MTAGLTQELDPKWEAPIPSPVLEMCVPLGFPALEAAQGHGLEREMW